MTIASELSTLLSTKSNIRNELERAGVFMSPLSFAEYHSAINSIVRILNPTETIVPYSKSGHILFPGGARTITKVSGLATNVGVVVTGSNGGEFTIAADGAWNFDPSGDFSALTGTDTSDTSVTYHASDGTSEAMGTLTVTVNAAQPWTPAAITTALWLDAADSSTITLNGSTVSEWRDKSGNNRHATQATTGNQATYSGNVLTFDAAAAPNYDNYNVQLAEYGALFFVVKKTSANDKGWLSRDNRNYDRDGLWITSSGSTALQRGADAGAITGGPIATIGEWNIVYAEANGTTRALRVNGGAATTVSSTAKIAFNQFGFYHYQPPMYCFEGQMAFVVGLPDAPSTELRQTIEGYLAHAVDTALGMTTLVDSLPSDHPYKTTAPTL